MWVYIIVLIDSFEESWEIKKVFKNKEAAENYVKIFTKPEWFRRGFQIIKREVVF